MQTHKPVTAYRFDDSIPQRNATVHCFKTLTALQDFAKLQGKAFHNVHLWEIKGTIIRDEGGPDGWVIKVSDYKELHHQLY